MQGKAKKEGGGYKNEQGFVRLESKCLWTSIHVYAKHRSPLKL